MNIKEAFLKRYHRPHVGLRTLKTVAAVIISMLLVETYGATSSKLIFAMLGAMAAVQPTFKESVTSCLTQIIGVLFGAVTGVVLLVLPLHSLVATGIGMVLVITLYNALGIRYSPSLPCFIVVMMCTTPDIKPMTYAVGRIWDTAIGLGVGMLINTLIFPYDNSRKIRQSMESLDRELISFLEDMFDGDEVFPEASQVSKRIDDMAAQLKIFSNQKLVLRLRRQKQQLEMFRICEGKARELVAYMEVLSRMEQPGQLNDDNRQKLISCGANIRDMRIPDAMTEQDVVTNYHVAMLLSLREQLLRALEN